MDWDFTVGLDILYNGKITAEYMLRNCDFAIHTQIIRKYISKNNRLPRKEYKWLTTYTCKTNF